MGTFSPDGKWVAFATNEPGPYQVFVQQFPHPNGKIPISTAGGSYPRWSADGKELFFIANNKMMSATIRTTGASIEAGVPVELFQAAFDTVGAAGAIPPYDVSRDGQFLVNELVGSSSSAPITILLNWKPKH
jgi:hypothetical protein